MPDRTTQWPATRTVVSHWLLVVAVAILGAVVGPSLVRLSGPRASSDIFTQTHLAASMVHDGGGLAYSVWYVLVYALSGGGDASERSLRLAGLAIIGLAVVARTFVAYALAMTRLTRPLWAAVAAVAAGLAMPIVDPARPQVIYLGQISANVWHNATLLTAMPFSLLAFAATVAFVRRPDALRGVLVGVALLVSTAAKPNYTLALLPVFAVVLAVLLWRGAAPRAAVAVGGLAALLPTAMLLIYQYLHVFGTQGVRGTHTVLAPFAVWSTFTPHIAGSLVVSIAGPALVLAAVPRDVRRSTPMLLAWSTLLVALLQTSLLAEASTDGTILTDGNYFWGSHAAMGVLMLVSIVELLRLVTAAPRAQLRRPLVLLASLALCAHVATGVFYVLHAGFDGFPVTRPPQ